MFPPHSPFFIHSICFFPPILIMLCFRSSLLLFFHPSIMSTSTHPAHQSQAAIDDCCFATISVAADRFTATVGRILPTSSCDSFFSSSTLFAFNFFQPLRQNKKRKPLYRVGWGCLEVGIFPQRGLWDWWSETPVTVCWSLIGEKSRMAMNMNKGAMKGSMQRQRLEGAHHWNSLGPLTTHTSFHSHIKEAVTASVTFVNF